MSSYELPPKAINFFVRRVKDRLDILDDAIAYEWKSNPRRTITQVAKLVKCHYMGLDNL